MKKKCGFSRTCRLVFLTAGVLCLAVSVDWAPRAVPAIIAGPVLAVDTTNCQDLQGAKIVISGNQGGLKNPKHKCVIVHVGNGEKEIVWSVDAGTSEAWVLFRTASPCKDNHKPHPQPGHDDKCELSDAVIQQARDPEIKHVECTYSIKGTQGNEQ